MLPWGGGVSGMKAGLCTQVAESVSSEMDTSFHMSSSACENFRGGSV